MADPIRTQDLNADDAAEEIKRSKDLDALKATKKHERSHERYEGGRAGVLEALDRRIAELKQEAKERGEEDTADDDDEDDRYRVLTEEERRALGDEIGPNAEDVNEPPLAGGGTGSLGGDAREASEVSPTGASKRAGSEAEGAPLMPPPPSEVQIGDEVVFIDPSGDEHDAEVEHYDPSSDRISVTVKGVTYSAVGRTHWRLKDENTVPNPKAEYAPNMREAVEEGSREPANAKPNEMSTPTNSIPDSAATP